MKLFNKTALKSSLAAAVIYLAGNLLPINALAFDYPPAGDFTKGAQQWADNCARCHNIRAANELRDDQWITTMFHMRVRAGLTGQETRNILTFLQKSNDTSGARLLKTSAAPATVSSGLSGKEIYDQTCIACHSDDGKGAFPGVPDFTDKGGRLSKSDSELFRDVMNGFQSPGSPMAMPPKGGNTSLTEGDIQSVIKYLHEAFGS
ncbi:Cytochrome c, class I [hydrothermal vent metagenome]|uniref:Cytochrome c, class I n=1 Tax=hydrothermal vent metagenome TaxID=652676 RepID=A0A3B0YBN3_9ZZZZ